MPAKNPSPEGFPLIRTAGLQGMLVSFADTLSEPANRATLAFRGAVERAEIAGVLETSTSLTSVYLRFDPSVLSHDALQNRLQELLTTQDWTATALPEGRKFWRVPTVYGTDLAPQLGEAADMAGMSEEQAIQSLSAARVRVLTIGFAPGQPYLGPLGAEWNLPRQTDLTPTVPVGALVLAISQFVLFATQAPTGWRHVGQTGLKLFQKEAEKPFALQPGDELVFEAVSKPDFLKICEKGPHFGGATAVEIGA